MLKRKIIDYALDEIKTNLLEGDEVSEETFWAVYNGLVNFYYETYARENSDFKIKSLVDENEFHLTNLILSLPSYSHLSEQANCQEWKEKYLALLPQMLVFKGEEGFEALAEIIDKVVTYACESGTFSKEVEVRSPIYLEKIIKFEEDCKVATPEFIALIEKTRGVEASQKLKEVLSKEALEAVESKIAYYNRLVAKVCGDCANIAIARHEEERFVAGA